MFLPPSGLKPVGAALKSGILWNQHDTWTSYQVLDAS